MTYGGYEVPSGQSKVLGHSYWLSVPIRGGCVQKGALGSEVVASRHLYRGCIESQVTIQGRKNQGGWGGNCPPHSENLEGRAPLIFRQ